MALSSSNIFDTTGIRLPKGACVVIVRTDWNAATINKLEEGCLEVLKQHGIQYHILSVPGAFEISFAVKHYWDTHKYRDNKPHAFITLGCVLRGDTPHFDYVCQVVTNGVLQLNLQLPVPVIFGVLTVDNQEQADERTGGRHGHKGAEAASTAIKMMAFTYQCKPSQGPVA